MFLVVASCYLLPHVVLAQKTDSLHRKEIARKIELDSIIIYGKSNSKEDATTVRREKLDIIQSATLGETLSRISGIQNVGFGPNSGAPMIRSLSGNRVKILTNGLGVNDLSGISPDLNISIDQDNIRKIDVYKGSTAVKYGGKAIGGAVNIDDGIIPNQINGRKFNLLANIEGASNSGFKQLLSINGNDGKKWAWTIGGSNRTNQRVRIPGNSKPDLCYNPEIVGFDPVLQYLCQIDVKSKQVLNVTLFPYISQFALDHFAEGNSYGLSERDKYTFNETYYDSKKGKRLPNPKNERYVAGQDPAKDEYKPEVTGINDYVQTTKGVIPNSHSEARLFHAGISYIRNNFRIGGAYRGSYTYYGIPAYAKNILPGHSHGDGHSHTHPAHSSPYLPINVRNRSHAALLQAELEPKNALFTSIKFNALSQYATDKELLEKDEVSSFDVKQQGARMEMRQKQWKNLTGISGADYNHRKIEGKGSLRFLPDNAIREVGVFTSQYFDYTPFHANIGYRYEHVSRKAMPDDTYKKGRGLAGGNLTPRTFSLNQFSAGVKLDVFQKGNISAAYSHSERAPEVNELYAGNNHFAIATEENGDDSLDKERANTIELGMEWKDQRFRVSLNYYHATFKNYLYLAHTGVFRTNGFIVKEWRAADTQINGMEANASYVLHTEKMGQWIFSGYYDYVINKNISDDKMRKFSDGDYMPNMPTSRFGFDISGALHKTALNISFDRYLKQTYLGKNIGEEHPMPPYSLLSARISHKANVLGVAGEYYLFGSNLLNVEARPQNSILKYLAPLPGINIGAGIKVNI